MTSPPPDYSDEVQQHLRSTWALCSSVFLMFYLAMSVFPYLGFMVMQLVPGLDRETVGVRVGFLASSFMMGRTFTAYAWGRAADVYGRKCVLVITLILSALGSLLFGCSTSYTMALIVRFVMGAGNGTMVVARTSISELAKGDKTLETKGVGILMSMVGYGMLICPALGGFLAEPLQQYPWLGLGTGALKPLLTRFPFLLPNIVACFLSLLSMLLVVIYVEETLPLEQRRHWSHLGTDMIQYIGNSVSSCGTSPSVEPTTKDPELASNETTPLTATPEKQPAQNSIQSIWNLPTTRAYLISAWCNHFASICVGEAFPLFAMSTAGGLGLDEPQIGTIGTLAGLWYCLGQYKIFQSTMKRHGLVRAMQYGSLVAVLPIALFPVSLLLLQEQQWVQMVFLSVVTAAHAIARSIFFGGSTIGCNRTVDAGRRAAMNGLSSSGTGFARALGPIFAGWLLAFSLTSAMVPEELGSWLAYAVLSVVAFLAYWSTRMIPMEGVE